MARRDIFRRTTLCFARGALLLVVGVSQDAGPESRIHAEVTHIQGDARSTRGSRQNEVRVVVKEMRATVLAACRTLGPLVPIGACRAAAGASRGGRGAARGRGGRGGGGGGGVGGARGGRGRGATPPGEVAGETRRGGRPSPGWGWDQRADAASEARRGLSTSFPLRDAVDHLASISSFGEGAFPDDENEDAIPQRVSKLMAWRGMCSRREAEELIDRGAVTVDGVVARRGDKVSSNARIELDDTAGATRWLRSKVTLVLNKPAGFVSNLPGPGETEASALITPRNALRETDRLAYWNGVDGRRGTETDRSGGPRTRDPLETGLLKLNVCGRLDKDSRGLVVLTQDGVLARAIIGGNEIPKTYVVRLDGPVSDQQIERLNGPVSLEGERLLPMVVERVPSAERDSENAALKFVLREGKNRQIRRVCAAAGLGVVDLLRVKVGRCELGDLPEGTWRVMTDEEREHLRAAGEGDRGGKEYGRGKETRRNR